MTEIRAAIRAKVVPRAHPVVWSVVELIETVFAGLDDEPRARIRRTSIFAD
jgi:hypothetical protein